MHLLELDTLTGEEYTCGSIDGLVKDAESFFENANEVTRPIQYSQTEFKDMPTTLCTLYGNLHALASRTGYDFSPAERRELCNLRKAEDDFDPAVGGLTARGVDVCRRWWNTRHVDNLVVTFAIDVTSELGRKMLSKNFPVSTSMRGNKAYYADAGDGTLNATQWGKSTFGHCRMRMGMQFYDSTKKPIHYGYPSIEAYMEAVKNGYERPVMYAYFLENELSTNGQKLVKYMKMKCWSGERENEPITRYEVAQIAKRLNPKIEESKLWNGTNPQKEASKYETSVIFNRAIGTEIYLGTDRNKSISRKQAILMLP